MLKYMTFWKSQVIGKENTLMFPGAGLGKRVDYKRSLSGF